MIITELQDLMNPHISHLLSLSDFKWHKMTKSYKEVLQMCLRLLTHWLPRCLGSDWAHDGQNCHLLSLSHLPDTSGPNGFTLYQENKLVELNSQK